MDGIYKYIGVNKMKNIRFYDAPKYSGAEYEKAENGIYMFHENGYDNEDDLVYVTSLVFEQEPECGENAPDSPYVSQYPLEIILDDFMCWCGDFYDKENEEDRQNSYVEFVCDSIEPIHDILSLAGKHVYLPPSGNELVIE